MSLWLIGSGRMAEDYARVLMGIGESFEVVGRRLDSATVFKKSTGIDVRTGGLSDALAFNRAPNQAIVAVGIEQLASITAELARAGTKRILVEKPAGLDIEQIVSLNEVVKKFGTRVFLAYNRRFYGSVQRVRECIKEDGGIMSANFEFTERSHVISQLTKGLGVKKRWVLGNSSHVMDLVFHLIGQPTDWKGWRTGQLDWHPSGSRFAGAGLTDKNVIFSYSANWQAPGSWCIELTTSNRRFILRPLEQLQVVSFDNQNIRTMDLPHNLDRDYKPGLYLQTAAFLNGEEELFCTLSEQVKNVRTYSEMAGYL